jgi:hypothetical protein
LAKVRLARPLHLRWGMRLLTVAASLVVLSIAAGTHAAAPPVTVVVTGTGARVFRGADPPRAFACTSPCQLEVEPGAELALRTSDDDERTVDVDAAPGDRVVIDPDQLARRANARTGGFVLVGIGSGATAVGLVWTLLTYAVGSIGCDEINGASTCRSPNLAGPLAVTGAGLAAVAGGIILVATAPPSMRVVTSTPAREPPPLPATGLSLRVPAAPATSVLTLHF